MGLDRRIRLGVVRLGLGLVSDLLRWGRGVSSSLLFGIFVCPQETLSDSKLAPKRHTPFPSKPPSDRSDVSEGARIYLLHDSRCG